MPDRLQQLLVRVLLVRYRLVVHLERACGQAKGVPGERKFVDHECASYLEEKNFLFEKGSWSDEK